jgi:oxalate decarboxylase/phosphoglucose isomerase-like protein (cupin superfamily)
MGATNADEWQHYLKGEGRMTVFASGGKSRTFDYQAGDVGAVPFAMGHYIQNTGDDTLTFLEMLGSEGPSQPRRQRDRRPAPHQAGGWNAGVSSSSP